MKEEVKTLFLFGLAVISLNGNADSKIEEVYVYDGYHAQAGSPVSYTELDEDFLSDQIFGQEPSFVLAKSPGITMHTDSGSGNGYSYFRLRGIDQTRINMTLNGVPLNEPEDQGVYFSNYPDFLSSVGNVQIQRGAGLSQNGSASYAGSIQFRVKELSEPSYGKVDLNYGSFGSRRLGAEYNSNNSDVINWFVRGSSVQSDGYKHRSENKSESIFASATITPENSEWKLTLFSGQQKNQLAWLGVSEIDLEENPKSNANSEEDDEFSQTLLVLNQKQDFAHFVLNSGVYYNTLEGNYDFDLNNFLGFPSTDEMLNYALDSNFKGFFSNINYTNNGLTLTAGFHTNDYSRTHKGSERSIGALYENEGFKDSTSIFLKSYYSFGALSVMADLQNRKTSFDYKGNTEFDKLQWNFFNPKLGINYQISDAVEAYYSIGKVGREPTRTDIFGGNDNLEVDENGNPLIFITDAESVVDQELGLRVELPRLSLRTNVYYMDFDNQIVLNGQFGPNGLALNEGVDSSTQVGAELSLSYILDEHFSLNSTVSLSKNKIEDNGEAFEPLLSPDIIAIQGVTYVFGEFSLDLDLQYQSASYLDFANTQRLDSHYTFSLRTAYNYGISEFSLHVNNLSNKKSYGSGYVDFDGTAKYFINAPRNITAQVSLRF